MAPMERDGILRTVNAFDEESMRLALTVFSDDMLINELSSRLRKGRKVQNTLVSLCKEVAEETPTL